MTRDEHAPGPAARRSSARALGSAPAVRGVAAGQGAVRAPRAATTARAAPLGVVARMPRPDSCGPAPQAPPANAPARMSPARNGEGGIRTHGPLRITGFQDRRLEPLGHLSRRKHTTLRSSVAIIRDPPGPVPVPRKRQAGGRPVDRPPPGTATIPLARDRRHTNGPAAIKHEGPMSASISTFCTYNCRRPGSNRGPLDPQSSALSN